MTNIGQDKHGKSQTQKKNIGQDKYKTRQTNDKTNE